MASDGHVLSMRSVERRFRSGDAVLGILQGASLDLDRGEIVALVAPSGTGKSTLLHLAGLLERPDAGTIAVNGREVGRLSDKERTALRRDTIGFVYQAHHLLAEFSALENVALPMLAAGIGRRNAMDRARDLLDAFALGTRAGHLPGRLSGGEKQRVAIARSLANGPDLLLADEPTGNLDVGTADVVFAELLRVSREHGVAALVATHNRDLAARMDRVVTLRRGVVVPA